jgi:hypothetical protein
MAGRAGSGFQPSVVAEAGTHDRRRVLRVDPIKSSGASPKIDWQVAVAAVVGNEDGAHHLSAVRFQD